MKLIFKFDKDLINKLNRMKKNVLLRVALVSLLFILLVSLLLIIQNRNIANLIIVLLAILTTIFICYLVIEFKEVLEPIKHYKKEIEYALNYQGNGSELIFVRKEDSTKTYLGIKCNQYMFLNSEKKMIRLYVQSYNNFELIENRNYLICSNHNFISKIEEL